MMSDWRDSRGLGRPIQSINITSGGTWVPGAYPPGDVISIRSDAPGSTAQVVLGESIYESTGTSELSTEDLLALKRYAEIGINVLGSLIPDRDAQGFLIPINYGPINRLMDIVAKRQSDVANMSAGKFPEPEADETI